MRRPLILLTAVALVLSGPIAVGAPTRNRAEGQIFVGGGTLVSNGVFFPGTAVYDGEDLVGHPYQIARGSDVTLTNLDNGEIANGHQLRSFQQRRGVPLFQSKRLEQPGESTTMITSHLKPGIYGYLCPIHPRMYGLLEITP